MKTFSWDQSFVTGLEEIDEQHHALVDLINGFGESLVAGEASDDAAVSSLFSKLAEYAQYHFSAEEALMLESGLATAYRERHRQLHLEFIRDVSSIWHARSTISDSAPVLHGFLCAWLALHVLGEDQHMSRQMALIREGKSPEEAVELAAKPMDTSTGVLLEALRNLYGVLAAQNRNLTSTIVRLGERVKEQRCLFELSALTASADKPLQSIFAEAVTVIPCGWFYPAITCARIAFEGRTYQTGNFRETPWHMHADIPGAKDAVGGIDVFYLEERPVLDEGPFLNEERSLLEELARMLSGAIERKTAEEIFNQFFDQPMGLHLIMRRDGSIVRVNPAWKSILGYDREEVEGRKAFDFVHPDDQVATVNELRKVSRGINTINFEQRGRAKNGEFKIISWSACASSDRQLICALGIDVTEAKLAETALRQQNDELERFNRAAVGRELEMINLKRQVNDLSGRLGQSAPFNLDFVRASGAAADSTFSTDDPAGFSDRAATQSSPTRH